jgi:hypothetical protein
MPHLPWGILHLVPSYFECCLTGKEDVLKTADEAIYLGGPPPTTNTSIQLEPGGVPAVSSANGHRIPTYLFWVVIAVCVILIVVIILLVVRNRRTP